MTNPINHHPASTMVAAPDNQVVFLEHVDSTARRHASRRRPTAAELGTWMRRRSDPNP